MAKSTSPHFVLSGIGTKGDLYPLTTVGRELSRRGHACDLLSNVGYEALAKECGLGFFPVTVPQTNNLVSHKDNLLHHVFPSFRPTFEYFEARTREGCPLVVINLDYCSASNLMSDRYGLPLIRLHLAPWLFNWAQEPPLPHIYAPKIYTAPFFVENLNGFRAEIGMPPIESMREVDALISRRICLFPRFLAEPIDHWPKELDFAGFPLAPSRKRLPPDLEAFLERGERPLVFTPGTGVVDATEFFEDARICCKALNARGVFLSPRYSAPSGGLGADIFHADFIDLDLLLSRSALLVHHGGIGTTARALEAGIPQVIRSKAYDQPDNGRRIASLGVGRSFLPDEGTPAQLIDAVAALLADTGVSERMRNIRNQVRQTDGIQRAADLIERALGCVQGLGQERGGS